MRISLFYVINFAASFAVVLKNKAPADIERVANEPNSAIIHGQNLKGKGFSRVFPALRHPCVDMVAHRDRTGHVKGVDHHGVVQFPAIV